MTEWLLDTNVLSELRRPKPDRNVIAFVAAQHLDTLHISVVTLAELRFGIDRVEDENKQSALNDWLASTIRPMFHGRTLPISEDVMLRWRLLVEEGRRLRHTFSQPDLIIAATALHHGMTIVSRDAGGFSRTGVPLHDPWTARGRTPLP